MSEADTVVQYATVPFDPDTHDRTAFSCGVEQVDNFFKKTANKLTKANNLRLYVKCSDDGKVQGFYAINAHAVHYTELPKRYARTRPGHGNIPASYISMIGRDESCRGQGIGDLLLVDALKRIVSVAATIGVAVIMLDVLDCGDPAAVEFRKATYAKHGFQSLPSNDLRMFLPVATILDAMKG